MSFAILAPDLLEALRILNLAGAESGTPSSDFFRVQSSKDSLIKLNVSGSVVAEVLLRGSGQWPIKEPFFIPRNLFSDWANEAKKYPTQTSFEFDFKEKLLIRNGTRQHSFDYHSKVPGYIDLPQLDGAKLELGPELIKLLECAALCATSEKQDPVLSCVYITPQKDTVELVATNQPTIIRIKAKAKLQESIVFPVNMLNVLKAEGLRSMYWTDRSVVAKFANGSVWHPLLQKATAEFPLQEMRTVVSDMAKERLLFRISLTKMAEMLGSVSNYLSSVRKDDWKMVVLGKRGATKLTLIVKLPYCAIREQLVCDPLKEDFRFVWPVDMVTPVLAQLEKNGDQVIEVRLSSDEKATYVGCGPIELIVSTREERERAEAA